MAIDGDGRSAFSWNAGGWFGGQLGGTLWLGVLGALTVARDRFAGVVVLGAFALLNLFGFELWRARRRVSAYAALQLLLGACAIAAVGVVYVFFGRGLGRPAPPGSLVSTELPPWLLLVFPGLMLFFYLRERASRRARVSRKD